MLCGIWVFIYIYLYLYLYLFIFSRESIVLCCFVIYNTLIPEHTSARAESRSFQAEYARSTVHIGLTG